MAAVNVVTEKRRRAADAAERELLECELGTHRWCVSAAARSLGIDRSNLRRAMRRLGIRRPS